MYKKEFNAKYGVLAGTLSKNGVQVIGSDTNTVSINAVGGDSDINISINPKGNGVVSFTNLASSIKIVDTGISDTNSYPLVMSGVGNNQSTPELKMTASRLYFVPSTGTLNAMDINSLSDETKKENISTIKNATKIVNSLRGVSFDWIDSGYHSIGVIAQELEKVLPFLVNTDSDGIKRVNYSALIGVLIEAIKEQNVKINELSDKLK